MRRLRVRRNRVASEALEERALLATITVTTLSDDTVDDSETTLREAVVQAATQAGADDIVFAEGLTGVVTLVDGPLRVSTDVSINGGGRDTITVRSGDGSNALYHYSGSGRSLTLQSLTIEGGVDSAGGSYCGCGARVTLDDVVVTGRTDGRAAVHIRNTETDSTRMSASITGSVITQNTGVGVSIQGGIDFDMADSVVSENGGRGVRIFDYSEEAGVPDVTISGALIESNNGGGVHVSTSDEFVLEDSLVTENSADEGAGVILHSGVGTIRRSAIIDNHASESGGGVFLRSGRIENSTISGNSAPIGGGIRAFLPSGVTIANSTVTGNTATQQGGGVFADLFQGQVGTAFESNIIAANSAPAGEDLIFAEPVAASSVVFDHNLLGSNADNPFVATGLTPDTRGNLVGTAVVPINPRLSSLQMFGLQLAHVPESDSPVLDRGLNSGSFASDQVGRARVQGIAPDIGAIEGSLSKLSVQDVSIEEGHSGLTNLIFTVTLTETTQGGFTFDATTVAGTASPGSDYVHQTATLSFDGNVGEMQQVTVQLVGDRYVEHDETFGLTFSNVSDTSIALPEDARGTILDDDTDGDIRIDARMLLIDGTPGNDTLDLTQNDAIVSVVLNGQAAELPESDFDSIEIRADDGDDIIIAVLVTDPMTVYGEAGNDTVKSGLADDSIVGGPGADNLRGTQGNDIILGGSGDDSLRGQVGDDTLEGGDGNDTLKGAENNDSLHGGKGDDEIEGGEGDDTLAGSGGDDTLLGEEGNDRLRGGGGRDLQDGGVGDDKAGGGSGADTLIGGDGADYLNAGDGPDQLIGGNGDDTLHGRGGDDLMLGEDGDDWLKGLQGRDIVYAGAGADTVFANAGDDLLIAGSLTPDVGLTLVEHLADVRAEWISGRGYDQRVSNVRNAAGASGDRNNTSFLTGAGRAGQNLFDDQARDEIHSGNNRDLFFARLGSDLNDRTNSEFLEEI